MSIPAIIRPWVWTLFWLPIIAFLLVMVLNNAQDDWRKKLLDEYWIKTYLSSPETHPDVVVLGNSLVGRSFPISSDEPNFFGQEIAWAKVWIGGASYRDFSDFFSDSSFQHELIIINLSTLANDGSHRGRRSLENYPDMVKEHLLFKPIKNIFEEFYKTAMGYCSSRNEAQIRKIVANLKKRYKPRESLDRDLALFLKSLKSASKKVVVIDMPRDRSLTEKLASFSIPFKQYVADLLKQEGIELVTLGEPMPNDHYCDGSHPNDIGREMRRVQLRNLVMERLPSTL